MERHDSAEDGLAFGAASGVFGDDARPNFDFVSKAEDTSEDGASSHAAFELFDLCTGFVDVE
jgi:hypothetical protein